MVNNNNGCDMLWWLLMMVNNNLVGGFSPYPSEKYEWIRQLGWNEIPNMMGKIKMFITTNQIQVSNHTLRVPNATARFHVGVYVCICIYIRVYYSSYNSANCKNLMVYTIIRMLYIYMYN